MKIIAIISGGMDSVSMLYFYSRQGYEVHALTFNYGQRHKKEIAYAQQATQDIGANWDLIDLSTLTKHIGGSSLTDNIPVPDGHYAEENMKITVVPNRNAIMLAIAYGVAVADRRTRWRLPYMLAIILYIPIAVLLLPKPLKRCKTRLLKDLVISNF